MITNRDVSSQELQSIQFEIKESSKKVLSECSITILPEKDKVQTFELELKYPAKNKKKSSPVSLDTATLGKLTCRLFMTDGLEPFNESVPPPFYPSAGEPDEKYKFFYEKHKKKLKVGDLIAFEEPGLLGTTVNLLTNSHYSRIGMIIKKKNKYTGEDKLFIAELARNPQKFVDSFEEVPITGFSLFRVWERVHGFAGGKIWWIPLKEALDKDPTENMVDWLTSMHTNGFTLDLNLHNISSNIASLYHELGFKDQNAYAEICSSLIFTQALKYVPFLILHCNHSKH